MIWSRIWKSDTYTILVYIGDPFQSVLEQIQGRGIWHVCQGWYGCKVEVKP